MRVLILSCNTGEGHNAAGRAVLEQARADGYDADMEDFMLMAGKRTSKVVGGSYVGMVKHMPRLFHMVYRVGELVSSSKRKSPVYAANTLMAKHLKAFLERHPYDVIVTPHLFPAETITYMKKHGMLHQKTVAVMTDYTCVPFWEETACDYYVVPHKDLLGECVDRGLPREKLLPFGIPVGLSFSQKKDKRQARVDCGLRPDAPVYLIMSGSMGFGRVNLFAAELARQCRRGEQIVIICGHNESMRKTLSRQFQGKKDVHIVGFTGRVSDYMDACDVVFTKPGGLSSTEAAVKRIPIVHTSPIPGCETKNVEFFTGRGMSLAAKQIGEQIACGNRLIYEPEFRNAMVEAQKKQISTHAAHDLTQFLKSLVEDTPL